MAHRDVNLKQAHTSDTFIESQSWNPELHTLGKINAGKFGKSANVYYRDITRFRLLLPVMSCPFGIYYRSTHHPLRNPLTMHQESHVVSK